MGPHRPHREHPVRLQRIEAGADALGIVERRIGFVRHDGRAVVDVEQHQVEGGARCCEPRGDVADKDAASRILEGSARERADIVAVPGHELRHVFGDLDLTVGRKTIERGAGRKAEAEPADQDCACMGAEPERDGGERFLGGVLPARHEHALRATRADHPLVSSADERERLAVGRVGRCDCFPGDHRAAWC